MSTRWQAATTVIASIIGWALFSAAGTGRAAGATSTLEGRAASNDAAYVALPVPDARGNGARGFAITQDGTLLGFRRFNQRDNQVHVWTLDGDTGRLTDFGIGDYLALSATGRELLYVPGAVPFGLRVANVASGDTVDFPDVPNDLDLVQLNQESIVFISRVLLSDGLGTGDTAWQVFAMNRTSRKVAQVSSIPPDPINREVQSLSIAAEGDLVAFVARPRTDLLPQVFVAHLTTGIVEQITQEADGCYDATMSADGARVACDSGRLIVVDTASHVIREVLASTGFRSQPKLSGNGRHLAFVTDGDLDSRGGNTDGNAEVFTWHADTGDFTQITDTVDSDSDPILWAVDADAANIVISLYSDLRSSRLRPYSIVAVKRHAPLNAAPVIVVAAEVIATLGETTTISVAASDPERRRIQFHVERADRNPPFPLSWIGDVELSDHGDGTATVAIRPMGNPRARYALRVAAFDPDGAVAVQNVTLTIQRKCAGDCDFDRQVSIDELVRQVQIALSDVGGETCGAGDLDGDQTISIAELVKSVEAALSGC